jgi:hypothetical protein
MRLKKFPTSFYISISIGFAQISGEDVIAKMMKNPSPSDIKMNFKMTLFSNSKEKKNKKHFRLMEQIEKRYQDGEFKSKLLLRFIEPKEVRGLSLLNWSRIDQKNDDQWLYIPKLRKVKRIRPSEKSRKFQGTEFTYADFINRDTRLDNYSLIGEDIFRGNPCFLVEARSINPSSFEVRIFWIDKTYYLLRKIQYLNEDQENAKILEIFDYVKNNQYWTPTKKIMKNLLNGNSTELQVVDIEYDQGVKDEFFSEKYLKRF